MVLPNPARMHIKCPTGAYSGGKKKAPPGVPVCETGLGTVARTGRGGGTAAQSLLHPGAPPPGPALWGTRPEGTEGAGGRRCSQSHHGVQSRPTENTRPSGPRDHRTQSPRTQNGWPGQWRPENRDPGWSHFPRNRFPEVFTQEARTQPLGGQADGLGHWSAGQLVLRCLGISNPLPEPQFLQQTSSEFLKGR